MHSDGPSSEQVEITEIRRKLAELERRLGASPVVRLTLINHAAMVISREHFIGLKYDPQLGPLVITTTGPIQLKGEWYDIIKSVEKQLGKQPREPDHNEFQEFWG